MMTAPQLAGMLGQTDAVMQSMVSSALSPYLPALQQAFIQAVEPAAAKAAEVAKPAIKEALADYAPMGIGLAALLFAGGLFTGLAIVNSWRKELKKK